MDPQFKGLFESDDGSEDSRDDAESVKPTCPCPAQHSPPKSSHTHLSSPQVEDVASRVIYPGL